eukprot:jgi/Mesen1/2707/ME000168S01773
MGRFLRIVLLCALVSYASVLQSAEARTGAGAKADKGKPAKVVCTATSCPTNSVCSVKANKIKCTCSPGFKEKKGQCLSPSKCLCDLATSCSSTWQ